MFPCGFGSFDFCVPSSGDFASTVAFGFRRLFGGTFDSGSMQLFYMNLRENQVGNNFSRGTLSAHRKHSVSNFGAFKAFQDDPQKMGPVDPSQPGPSWGRLSRVPTTPPITPPPGEINKGTIDLLTPPIPKSEAGVVPRASDYHFDHWKNRQASIGHPPAHQERLHRRYATELYFSR